MRTLLIYPPYTSHVSDPIKANPPLGLAYIAAVLGRENYDVEILDALALGIDNMKYNGEFVSAGLSDNDIGGHIKKYDPDIVGIYGGVTSNIQNAHNCAKIAKGVNPDIKVIFGGPHSTSCSYAVLEDDNVDLIIRGEGEFTFLDIVQTLEKDKEISKVKGISYRRGSWFNHNEIRPYIEDLDSLPFPAWHLLPMDIYARGSKTARDHYMRHPRMNMITSRGCPGNCRFCSISSIFGHKWRSRSPNNVLDEISLLVGKYNIREIAFYDDNISLNNSRFTEICEGVVDRGLDITWDAPNGMAIWTLNKEVIGAMAKSGCYRVMFGIESGCIETQKYIRKVINLDFAGKIIKQCRDAGLWTQSTFIIGFPYETRDSIDETLRFILESDLDFVRIYIAAPIPGTDMCNDFVREGLVGEGDYTSVNYGGIDTKHFTAEELRGIQNEMYSKFIRSRMVKFMNPLRWWKRINSMEKLRYAVKVSRIALKASLSKDSTIKLQKDGA